MSLLILTSVLFSGAVLIESFIFLLCRVLSSFLACPVIFDRLPNIVNLTLWDTGYFYIPVNIVLCFGILLNYWEKFDFFGFCF